MKINFFKKLSGIEKAMIGIITLLLLMILLNWTKVFEGIKKGIKPYQDKTKTEIKHE